MSTGVTQPGTKQVRSRADGGVVAQLRLDHDDLLLGQTLPRVPDVTIEPEYWTTLESGQDVVYCTVTGETFDAFEEALLVDTTVSNPVLVDRYPDRRVYRLTLTDHHLPFVAPTASVCAHMLDVYSTADGWIIELRFPTRDALAAFNDHCRERDISLHVNHLQVSDDDEDPVLGLTPKQQTLLSIAYEAGYFEVPRGITQNELAAQLGISKSAVSQRLRRAIAQLCAQSLS